MTSGAPDHTIKIYLEKALGFEDKLPVWEVAPVTGRYYATPPTLTDEDFGPALLDSSGRLIVKAIPTTGGDTIDVNVTDRAARLLGVVYGSQGQKLQQKATTFELLTYDSFIETLLADRLPATLDTGALKVKEQSPITDFPDSAVATLLGDGLPSALDTDALKVREQGTVNVDLDSISGTSLTAADWSTYFDNIPTLDGKFPAAQQFPSVETTIPSGSYIGAMLYGLDYGSNYMRALDVSAANKLRLDIASVGATLQTARDWSLDFRDNNRIYKLINAGRGFSLECSTASCATGTWYNLIHLHNPADSGRILKVYYVSILRAVAATYSIGWEIRCNPNITANGTAATACNLRCGNATASITNSYCSPTANPVNNGCKMHDYWTGLGYYAGYGVDVTPICMVEEDDHLFINGLHNAGITGTIYSFIKWVEDDN